MLITLDQIRAARAMLRLKQQDLAKKAGISTGTLNNIERGVQKDPKLSTLKAIQQALEREGIVFTEAENGALGIRLKPASKSTDTMTLLIIDDDDADRKLFKTWLSKQAGNRYTVVEADNALDGYEALLKYNPAVILLDFNMYGINGLQLIAEMKNEQTKLPPIIFVTGMHSEEVEREARENGVYNYLSKQHLSAEKLAAAVYDALVHHAG